MKPRITRLCIYPKDIQRITGKSERYCRDLIHKIRKSLHKEEHQVITTEELSTYLGIPLPAIQKYITD